MKIAAGTTLESGCRSLVVKGFPCHPSACVVLFDLSAAGRGRGKGKATSFSTYGAMVSGGTCHTVLLS